MIEPGEDVKAWKAAGRGGGSINNAGPTGAANGGNVARGYGEGEQRGMGAFFMILPPHDSVAVGRLSDKPGRHHPGRQLSPAPAGSADARATVQERSDTAASVAPAASRQHPSHVILYDSATS